MAKWNFRIVKASLVKELIPVDGDVEYRAQSFMEPSFDLQGDKIVIKESGAYKTAVVFSQIGEIDGETPTNIQDAYEKLLDLVENFNGGGGAPGTTPNLTQVLNVGDRVIKEPDDTDYTFIGSDINKWMYFSNSLENLILDDPDDGTFLDYCSIPIQIMGDCLFNSSLGTNVGNNFLVDGSLQQQAVDWVLKANDVLLLKKAGDSTWFLQLVYREKIDVFELQFTQTVVDEPPTILSGSIKGNKGATITPSRVSTGVYRFTSNLPIFADLKDCYSRTDYYDLNIVVYNSFASSFGWLWYVVSDTVIEAVTLDGAPVGSPQDELIINPVLLRAEYK